MLKKAVVCIMLVAASAMAWLRLTDVPEPAEVDTFAHLAWGNGLVWGVFPTDGAATYLFTYDPTQVPDPDSATWDTLELMSAACLKPCNITFQTGIDPTLWGIGKTGGLSLLYCYPQYVGDWSIADTIDSFELGDGASIAYAPNPGFDPLTSPIPGYLYCLPDDSTSFWKYGIAVTDLPDTGTYGYLYPDTGATIADQTPKFRWNPSGVAQYRIQVATSPTFGMSIVIDEVVYTNEYESTIELANGIYFWRTAAWSGGQWVWCAAAYYWFELSGGWLPLRDIDSVPHRGAEIAYDAGSFDTSHTPGILAIYNRTHRQFSRYIIEGDCWQWWAWDDTPHDVKEGSSLTTSALVEGAFPYHIDAAFYNQQEDDYPYIFCNDSPPGHQWQQFILQEDTADYYTGFPDDIDAGSSMIIGADSFSYLITGKKNGNKFYRVEPADFAGRGGEQCEGTAHLTPSVRTKAQVITARNGIEVEYLLPAAARVRAVLHDAVGRRVGMLDAGEQNSGTHRLGWSHDQEGRRLSAGAYFLLLDIGTEHTRLKAVVE